MFRSRSEELCYLIELYQSLDTKTPENQDSTEALKNIEAKLLQNEIESLCTEIIESIIQSKFVDSHFIDQVYLYDKILFERIFKSAIAKGFQKNNFNTSLMIVLRMTYFLQAIIGYESIYQQMIVNKSTYKKELYELSKKLGELVSMEGFGQLPENERTRAMALNKRLQPYLKYVPEKPKPKEPSTSAEEEGERDTKGLEAVLNVIESDSMRKKEYDDLSKELNSMSELDFSKLTEDQKARVKNLIEYLKPQISKLKI